MEMYPKFKPDASFIGALFMEMYPKFKPEASFICGPVYGNVSEIQTRR